MILNDTDGTPYYAHFHHSQFNPPLLMVRDHDNSTYLIKFRTECALHKGPCASKERTESMPPCQTPSAIGVSKCSVLDNFGPLEGRLRALTHAMKEAHLPRNVRAALWKDYFSKTPRPAPKNIRFREMQPTEEKLRKSAAKLGFALTPIMH